MPFVELRGGPFDGAVVFVPQILDGDYIAGGVMGVRDDEVPPDWTYEPTDVVTADGNIVFEYRTPPRAGPEE